MNALFALHGLLLQSQAMAREHRPSAEIVEVLEVAEHLVALLLAPTDETLAFRGGLESAAERYPKLRSLGVERFDRLVCAEPLRVRRDR